MASVRQEVVNAIISKLQQITVANNYSFDVGSSRVYRKADSPELMPTPSIIAVQGEESIENEYSDLYECSLDMIIGFVDQYSGDDPETYANSFLRDIQTSLDRQFEVTVKQYGTGNSSTTTVQMKEQGNTITVSEALQGYVLGQVVYDVRYRRHTEDPDSI